MKDSNSTMLVTLTTDQLRALISEAVDAALLKKHEVASDVITRDQAAKILGVHPVVVARYAKHRGLPGMRMGREWRFRRSAILRWLEEQAVKPGAPTVAYARKIHEAKESA
ncbi:MAG: helix-turn-helix domain-containing protein [Mycobacteriales bacterium]